MRGKDPRIQALFIRLKNCRGLRGRRFTERFIHVLVNHVPSPQLDFLIDCNVTSDEFLEDWFESAVQFINNKLDRIIARMQERGIYPTRESLLSPDINLGDLIRLPDFALAEEIERIINRAYRDHRLVAA